MYHINGQMSSKGTSEASLEILVSPLTFFVSAPQEDCLWRSSLKVPRATRPLSDCCSRTRDPLVSSEDRDNDAHMHPAVHMTEAQSPSHTPLTKQLLNTPCLNVYIHEYLSFGNMAPHGFSVD